MDQKEPTEPTQSLNCPHWSKSICGGDCALGYHGGTCISLGVCRTCIRKGNNNAEAKARWDEEKRNPAPPLKIERPKPSFAEMAASLGKAVTGEAGAIVRGVPPVQPEVAKARLDICKACEHFKERTGQCKLCNCFMKVKTTLRSASCPIKKWTNESTSGNEPRQGNREAEHNPVEEQGGHAVVQKDDNARNSSDGKEDVRVIGMETSTG